MISWIEVRKNADRKFEKRVTGSKINLMRKEAGPSHVCLLLGSLSAVWKGSVVGAEDAPI